MEVTHALGSFTCQLEHGCTRLQHSPQTWCSLWLFHLGQKQMKKSWRA